MAAFLKPKSGIARRMEHKDVNKHAKLEVWTSNVSILVPYVQCSEPIAQILIQRATSIEGHSRNPICT